MSVVFFNLLYKPNTSVWVQSVCVCLKDGEQAASLPLAVRSEFHQLYKLNSTRNLQEEERFAETSRHSLSPRAPIHSASHPGPQFTFSLFSRSTDGNIIYFQVFTLEWTLSTDMIHLCSWVTHPVWIPLFIQDVLTISNQSNRDKYSKTWALLVKSHLTGSV